MRWCLGVTCALVLSAHAAAGAQAAAPEDSAATAARRILWALARRDYVFASQHTDAAQLRRTRVAFDSVFAADTSRFIAMRIFGADSAGPLRKLTDAEFTAKLLEFWLPVTGADQVYKDVRDLDVAGTIRGRDTALVAHRWRYKDEPGYRSYRVETMVRCGADWCTDMVANFDGLLAQIRPTRKPD